MAGPKIHPVFDSFEARHFSTHLRVGALPTTATMPIIMNKRIVMSKTGHFVFVDRPVNAFAPAPDQAIGKKRLMDKYPDDETELDTSTPPLPSSPPIYPIPLTLSPITKKQKLDLPAPALWELL